MSTPHEALMATELPDQTCVVPGVIAEGIEVVEPTDRDAGEPMMVARPLHVVPGIADPSRTSERFADETPLSVVGFPNLNSAALQGTAGEIVRAVAPTTEAHPAALLAILLANFGAWLGPGAHLQRGNAPHPGRIWPLITGRSSDGAKGTAQAVIDRIFREVTTGSDWPLRLVRGLSSGEGLMELVADEKDEDTGELVPRTDRRLLVIEEEYAQVLAQFQRSGNTLSTTLRQAWDGKTLQSVTRSNPMTATEPSITLIGHVTPRELRDRMTSSEVFGGGVNRMLIVASRRARLLPEGGNLPEDLVGEISNQLADRIRKLSRLGEVPFTPAARDAWAPLYEDLSRPRPDGPVAALLARSRPMVLRIALTYALLDGSQAVDAEHLQAARALWQYAEDSIHWLYGQLDNQEEVQALLDWLAEAGEAGRSKSDVTNLYAKKNKKAAERAFDMLTLLIRDGLITQDTATTGRGRPGTRFKLRTPPQAYGKNGETEKHPDNPP
ncbi:hypothetical protein AB0L88_44455 [Saccharopolyspora shandongensis]|uniref:hypothetical protein n=1 Tax=Saccharopolyspora shandongensis TaxID=418495 RepID=UPI003440445B